MDRGEVPLRSTSSLKEPPRMNVIEVGLILRMFANNLAGLVLSQDKLAGAPSFV